LQEHLEGEACICCSIALDELLVLVWRRDVELCGRMLDEAVAAVSESWLSGDALAELCLEACLLVGAERLLFGWLCPEPRLLLPYSLEVAPLLPL
jgi:hypothetical protein